MPAPSGGGMYVIYGVKASISLALRGAIDRVAVEEVRSKDSFVRNTAPTCEVIWDIRPSLPFPLLRGVNL